LGLKFRRRPEFDHVISADWGITAQTYLEGGDPELLAAARRTARLKSLRRSTAMSRVVVG
jgi:hypothetical protein